MISLSSIQSTPPSRSSRPLLHHNVQRLRLPSVLELHRHHQHWQNIRVRAIEAAQPHDCGSRLIYRLNQSTSLKIAIAGFENLGQFLAKAFIRQGHTVYAHSRSNYLPIAESIGAAFFSDPHDLCEQNPDVMLICTSIISTESMLRSLPLQRLNQNTLFVDTLSVKEFPKNIFLQVLPPHFDILCTHPMFGRAESWKNSPFVFDKVRIGNEEWRVARVENFLDIFNKEGCRMVEMSCEEHDEYAAGPQLITHTTGWILEKLQLESTPINTKGYQSLLDLVKNTAGDSFDLYYYGLFVNNQNAMEHLEKLDSAFEALKEELSTLARYFQAEAGAGEDPQQ